MDASQYLVARHRTRRERSRSFCGVNGVVGRHGSAGAAAAELKAGFVIIGRSFIACTMISGNVARYR